MGKQQIHCPVCGYGPVDGIEDGDCPVCYGPGWGKVYGNRMVTPDGWKDLDSDYVKEIQELRKKPHIYGEVPEEEKASPWEALSILIGRG